MPLTLLCTPGGHELQPELRMQVFCRRQWDMLLELLPYVPFDRPAHVLDAGANIGLASLLFVPFIHHHGTITSVEASAANFEQLQRNVGDIPGVRPTLAALVPAPEAGQTVRLGSTSEGHFWGTRIQTAVAKGDGGWAPNRLANVLHRALGGRLYFTRGASGTKADEAQASDMGEVSTVSLPQLEVCRAACACLFRLLQ